MKKSFYLLSLAVFFLHLSLLVTTHSSVNFTPGTFFAYNQTVIMVLPNGTTTTIHEVILQRVMTVYPNNTMIVNVTVYNTDQRYYLPPSLILTNVSFPTALYYIPPNLLGENVTRGGGELYYKGFNNGLYEYESISNIQGVEIKFFMWVNSSGIAEKVQTLQIGAGLQLVSNSTAVLWKSNYFSPSSLPTFPDYTQAEVYKASLNQTSVILSTAHKLVEYIIFAGVLAILIILLFRK